MAIENVFIGNLPIKKDLNQNDLILLEDSEGTKTTSFANFKKGIFADGVTAPPVFTVNSEVEFQNLADKYSMQYDNQVKYGFLLFINYRHSVMGGGTFWVEGIKATAEYETQSFWSYWDTSSGQTGIFTRTKRAGVWNLLGQLTTKQYVDNRVESLQERVQYTNIVRKMVSEEAEVKKAIAVKNNGVVQLLVNVAFSTEHNLTSISLFEVIPEIAPVLSFTRLTAQSSNNLEFPDWENKLNKEQQQLFYCSLKDNIILVRPLIDAAVKVNAITIYGTYIAK